MGHRASFTFLGASLLFMAVTAFAQMRFMIYVIGYVLAQVTQSATNGTMQVLGSDLAPVASRGRFFGIWRTITSSGGLASPRFLRWWLSRQDTAWPSSS